MSEKQFYEARELIRKLRLIDKTIDKHDPVFKCDVSLNEILEPNEKELVNNLINSLLSKKKQNLENKFKNL